MPEQQDVAIPTNVRGALDAIMVTYRRAAQLEATLQWLVEQTHLPRRLIVVDNAPEATDRRTLRAFEESGCPLIYLPQTENGGPAGGRSIGMEYALRDAADEDWMVMLDDDLRRFPPTVLANLLAFAQRVSLSDPRTAGVGLRGARFDPKKVALRKASAFGRSGPIPVDYLPTNLLPLFRASAVRKAGYLDQSLFIGMTEVEYGLRLRRLGFSLYIDAELARATGLTRAQVGKKASLKYAKAPWRRYYALRNMIHILRREGRDVTALRVAFVRGLVKPLLNFAIEPRAGLGYLRLSARAVRDGWSGRMGRTVPPEGYPGNETPVVATTGAEGAGQARANS